MQLFHYRTSCVESNAPAIQAMVDEAKEVSFDTIKRHCLGLDKWEKQQGYSNELKLEHDHHVRYFQSTFEGRECYFIVHSAIEYIWTKHEHVDIFLDAIEDRYLDAEYAVWHNLSE